MTAQNNVNNLNKDASWVRQSFLVQYSDLQPVDQQNRTFTAASFDFEDTAPGGSLCINPPPQFTRYADLKPLSAYGVDTGGKNRAGNTSLGRYYSEVLRANSQIINIRCGVPSFNSLTTFFSGFYNTSAGTLARTGRAPSAFYELGRAAGFVVSILSWKLLAVTLLGNATRFFLQKPSSKFYYSKPAMTQYWNAVQTIANQIAVNMGIVPRIGGTSLAQTLGQGYAFDAAAQTQLHQLLPDIINEGGSIDIYAMANRAQRLQTLHNANLQTAYNTDTLNLTTAIQTAYTQSLKDPGGNWSNYLQKWVASSQGQTKAADGSSTASTTESLNNDANGTQTPSQAYDSGFMDFLKAELNDGSQFVSFRVNATGSVGESFTSQFQDSEIKQKINGISSQARSAEFDLANGNIFGGVIGQTLGAALGAATDLTKGVLDSVSLSGLAALGGSAFVDIPRNWQDSAASLPRMNYTINLVSPYGNRISQFLNLHVPLAMLLAMSLPISTGKQSYTSPFLVEIFDRGRCQSRLAMVDSLSITRGTGNTGWNREGHCMALEVNISFADMSTVLAMPISQGFSSAGAAAGTDVGILGGAVVGAGGGPVTAAAGAALGGAIGGALGSGLDALNNAAQTISSLFDDDNTFTDYLAVLSGQGLTDQIYSMNKFKQNLTRAMTTWKTWYSTAHFASFMGDTLPGHVVSAVMRGTQRN